MNRIEKLRKELKRKKYLLFADSKEFSLKSLSNLSIYARQNDASLFPYIFCADGISRVLNYLSESKLIKELYYVTIFFYNLHRLMTTDIMTQHKAKTKQLLNEINPKESVKELLMVCGCGKEPHGSFRIKINFYQHFYLVAAELLSK